MKVLTTLCPKISIKIIPLIRLIRTILLVQKCSLTSLFIVAKGTLTTKLIFRTFLTLERKRIWNMRAFKKGKYNRRLSKVRKETRRNITIRIFYYIIN